MQGTPVRSLVQEDSTRHGATKPVCHGYWAHAPEPGSRSHWSLRARKLALPGKRSHHKRSLRIANETQQCQRQVWINQSVKKKWWVTFVQAYKWLPEPKLKRNCDLVLPREVIKAEMSETLTLCIREGLSLKCQTSNQSGFPFLCKCFSFFSFPGNWRWSFTATFSHFHSKGNLFYAVPTWGLKWLLRICDWLYTNIVCQERKNGGRDENASWN